MSINDHEIYNEWEYVVYNNSIVWIIDESSFLWGKWRFMIDWCGLYKESDIVRLANNSEIAQHQKLQERVEN